MHKKFKFLASLSCFIFAVSALADNAAASDAQNKKQLSKITEADSKRWDFIPDVVARVGENDIKKDQLVRILNSQVKMMLKQGQTLDDKKYKDIALADTNKMIEGIILKNILSDAGYKMTPEFENEAYNKFRENVQKKMPPEEAKNFNFEDMIKQKGVNPQTFKKQLAKDELLAKYVKAQILPKITVTDSDIQKYYNDNKDKFFKKPETVTASQILIAPKDDSEASWDAAKAQAEDIYKQLLKGDNFEELADKYNEGTKNGGQLGEITKGQMPAEFETAVWKLANNGMKGYEVVKTQFGWHIVKVTAYDQTGSVSLNDKLKIKIKQVLEPQEVSIALNAIIKEQKKKIKVEVYLK